MLEVNSQGEESSQWFLSLFACFMSLADAHAQETLLCSFQVAVGNLLEQ